MKTLNRTQYTTNGQSSSNETTSMHYKVTVSVLFAANGKFGDKV